MLSSSIGIHSKTIEIFENERYSPIGGWSSKSLMLTDRSPVSIQDGTSGWPTLEEASNALLSRGWVWETENWEVDTTSSNVDAEGWSYSVDFQRFTDSTSGNSKKGALHFVRRKRKTRSQYFDVNTLCKVTELTCDHCDLQEVDKLSTLFLEKLAAASVVKHPRQLNEPKMVALKNGFLSALGFVMEAETEGDSQRLKGYEFNLVASQLEAFVNQGRTALSMASSALVSGTSMEALSKRIVEVADNYFSHEERSELARLLLRKFDIIYEFHCEKVNCGEGCQFTVEMCPHQDCGVKYSRKWAKQHDSICPQKVVDCDRTCGETLMRKLMDSHLCSECVLRPVTCVFAELGCPVEGLVFKNLEEHMHFHQCQHLELSLNRLKEHQSVITALHRQIKDLEVTVAAQKEQITALEVGAAAAVTALALHEKKQDKALRDAVYAAEQKAQRKSADVSAEMHSEINKLKKVIAEMNKR